MTPTFPEPFRKNPDSPTQPDADRADLEALPCIQQAGGLNGFIAECAAESKTLAMAELRELQQLDDVDENEGLRLVLETIADVMTRRVSQDIRGYILTVLEHRYPNAGVLKP